MNPRDAYLAYQAEIGTEDVILAEPWIRKTLPTKTAAAAAATPQNVVHIKQGPDFFQSISDSLKSNSKTSKPKIESEPLQAFASLPTVPEFKDLDAYWKYLAAEYPVWFSSNDSIVRSEGTTHPILAIVELSPTSGKVFDGESGLLLDKMMKAIHLDRSQLYLTSVMKTAPAGKSWARKDIARMLPFFFRELALAGCSIVLLCGEGCGQTVLRSGKNLESLRRQPNEIDGMTFVASYHPSEMEVNQDLKRGAWEDLKWLRPKLGGGIS